MEIVWKKRAKLDLKNYFQNSRVLTDDKIETYISSLVDYIDILSITPYLGKEFCNLEGTQLRELIFRMHRIFYYIKKDKIYILHVVHTSKNIENVIEYLKSLIDL